APSRSHACTATASCRRRRAPPAPAGPTSSSSNGGSSRADRRPAARRLTTARTVERARPPRPSALPEAARAPSGPSRSACRSPRAPCPSRGVHPCRRSRVPFELEAFDLLVEVRARHVEPPRRLAHIPVELRELRAQERALGVLLEGLIRFGLQQSVGPARLAGHRA